MLASPKPPTIAVVQCREFAFTFPPHSPPPPNRDGYLIVSSHKSKKIVIITRWPFISRPVGESKLLFVVPLAEGLVPVPTPPSLTDIPATREPVLISLHVQHIITLLPSLGPQAVEVGLRAAFGYPACRLDL
ncbi:G-type lectin S-receptor-like serine/threonine-protein kinase RLK1-like protein [Anopheles sinensis]|uniref:G-type lectin S-receptor-like serine/threonine-protein kinase RLK1-like protein n=1 Tax=Anopheles sinensis TaxID=74873 RepID=A0A084WHP1_ANOSI|nr:G-type lectin S-receptor-like serine/threonine-protein kinase RLK1-like protein [Anopheles sinensis]